MSWLKIRQPCAPILNHVSATHWNSEGTLPLSEVVWKSLAYLKWRQERRSVASSHMGTREETLTADRSLTFVSVPPLLAHHRLSWDHSRETEALLAPKRLKGDLLLWTQLCPHILAQLSDLGGSTFQGWKGSGRWSTHSLGHLSAGHGYLQTDKPHDTSQSFDSDRLLFCIYPCLGQGTPKHRVVAQLTAFTALAPTGTSSCRRILCLSDDTTFKFIATWETTVLDTINPWNPSYPKVEQLQCIISAEFILRIQANLDPKQI